MSPSRRLLLGLALALAAAAPACASRARVAASLDDVRRWTTVVVRADPGVGEEEARLIEREARAALGATGRFLPIPPASEVHAVQAAAADPWRDGPPPALLVDLARRGGADALALLDVCCFDPYPPARIRLTIEVHSTVTGGLLFSNDVTLEPGVPGLLDASDPVTSALRGKARPAPSRLLSRSDMARSACEHLVAPIVD